MSIKSFLLTLAIFCGGYVSNTLLDNAVDAAEKYFHLSTAAYKSDSNGYIICSNEKPKDSPVGPIVAAPANFQWEPSGATRLGLTDVRYWHLADISLRGLNVSFGGKVGIIGP